MKQVLKYYDAIVSDEDLGHESTPLRSIGIGQNLKRFVNRLASLFMGQKALLKRRCNRLLSKAIKIEGECDLTIQEKIILLSKAITFCDETFGFAPSGLEKRLVKKVEEMKHAVIGQLN